MPGTDTLRHMRQDYLAFFGQDDWHVRNDLTLSVGLRYEFVTTPSERDGQVAGLLSFDDLESGPHGVTPGSPLFDNPSKKSFAPRLGLSWVLGRDRRTVVRAGYGLFYQPLTVSYYRGTIFRIYPWFAGVDIRQPAVFGPGIQDVLNDGVDAQRRSEFIAYDAEQPFIQHWHASAERDLGAGFTAEIGYLGSNGRHLPFYGDPNAVPSERLPDGSKRVFRARSLRYPELGTHPHPDQRGPLRRPCVDPGSAAALHRRAGAAGRLHVHPLERHVVRRTDGHVGLRQRRGERHGLVGSRGRVQARRASTCGTRSSPTRPTTCRGAAVSKALPARWRAGGRSAGVAQLASGLPFTPFIGFDQAHDLQSDADTIQKPDLAGPITYPHTRDEWFDVNAFALPQPGYYGSASRNLLRGPGLKLVDLAVVKTITAGATKLQLRLEAFNVCNWVNLGLPNASVLFNEDGTYRAGAARITTTATSARQLQLGVKWLF